MSRSAPATLVVRRQARNRRGHAVYWLLLPGLGYIVLFFLVPLALMVAWSFGLSAFGAGETAFTLKNYVTFFTEPIYRSSFGFTVYIGLASALGSLVVAIPLSLWLRRQFAGRNLIAGLLKAPMVIPGLIATFMIMTVIAPGGMINQILQGAGILHHPLQLTQDQWGIGILIVQMWKNVPFMTVILTAVMIGINQDVIDAARNLGATRWQLLRHVILPLAKPGISTAFLITFVKAYGGYEIPSLIGPVFRPTLPVLMTTEATVNYNWGMASMLGTVIAVSGFAVVVLYYWIMGEDQEGRRSA